jgi:hypothetical protein
LLDFFAFFRIDFHRNFSRFDIQVLTQVGFGPLVALSNLGPRKTVKSDRKKSATSINIVAVHRRKFNSMNCLSNAKIKYRMSLRVASSFVLPAAKIGGEGDVWRFKTSSRRQGCPPSTPWECTPAKDPLR